MYNRRVQLLLDERRYGRVAREAKRRQISMCAVIRDAIDAVTPDLERRRAAIDRILSAPRMPVPADPADLRRELDEAHDRIN